MLVASFICYLIVGMSPFDAINHAMSVTATGGFSTRNLSIGAFDSVAVDLVTMFFMLLSSIHFGMVFIAIVTRSIKPFKNEIFKFYIWTLLISSVVVMVSLKVQGVEETWGSALLSGSFQPQGSAFPTTQFGLRCRLRCLCLSEYGAEWPAQPPVASNPTGHCCFAKR